MSISNKVPILLTVIILFLSSAYEFFIILFGISFIGLALHLLPLAVFGILLVVFNLACLYGILAKKQWARKTTIYLQGVEILIVVILQIFSLFVRNSLILETAVLVFFILFVRGGIIFYLKSEKAKYYFLSE